MFFDTSLLIKIKETAEKGGIKAAAIAMLRALGVNSIRRIGCIPQSGPVLIIANHNGVFDGLVIASGLERDDYHFVALATYAIFGKKVREQLIPIYRKKTLNHLLFEFPLALAAGGEEFQKLHIDEIKKSNRDSINLASQCLNNGHSVSIYPMGTVGKRVDHSKWKPGVGYLIKQIHNPATKIVFAKITGTRQTDVIAYMHPMIRKLLFRPQPIAIQFAKSVLLADLVDINTDPKAIVRVLEKKYEEVFSI